MALCYWNNCKILQRQITSYWCSKSRSGSLLIQKKGYKPIKKLT